MVFHTTVIDFGTERVYMLLLWLFEKIHFALVATGFEFDHQYHFSIWHQMGEQYIIIWKS